MSDDKKWPKINPATVAPLLDGRPDFYNHQPTRFVSKEEAKARGWKHYWTGEVCVTGHRAARYLSNGSICVDCERIKKGKAPVYGKGVPELEAARRRAYTQKQTQHLQAPPQPNAAEKKFLEKYAELKDFTLAAEALGRTDAEFLAVLSWNELFRDAVNRLEESMGIARTQKLTDRFDWDEEKRRIFLLTYANTADLKQAFRSVGVTNVQFHKELSENADFQRDFDEATQIARSVFDHAASATAIRGDSKLLGRIAANLFPEKFGENLKMDLNVKQNMTLDQAHAQLSQILSGLNRQGLLSAADSAETVEGTVIDAEYIEVEPTRDVENSGSAETADADAGADPNSDLVSGS